MSQNPSTPRRRAILERIDPRVLYSADPIAPLGPAVAAAPVSIAQPPTQAVVAVQAQAQHGQRELVVVDARVPDSERLLADLHAQQAQGRALTILTVLPGEDALVRIDAALSQAPGQWSAIHLIGHGQAGEMNLGDTRIDIDLIRARAEDFAGWAQHLAEGADLMLYGCDLAANEAGQAVVEALAGLTGADVAASVDATGSALLGGNWTLEYQRGLIGAQTAFSTAIEAGWNHLLAGDIVVQNGNVVTEDNTSYQNTPQNSRTAASNATGRTAAVWLDTSSGRWYSSWRSAMPMARRSSQPPPWPCSRARCAIRPWRSPIPVASWCPPRSRVVACIASGRSSSRPMARPADAC